MKAVLLEMTEKNVFEIMCVRQSCIPWNSLCSSVSLCGVSAFKTRVLLFSEQQLAALKLQHFGQWELWHASSCMIKSRGKLGGCCWGRGVQELALFQVRGGGPGPWGQVTPSTRSEWKEKCVCTLWFYCPAAAATNPSPHCLWGCKAEGL